MVRFWSRRDSAGGRPRATEKQWRWRCGLDLCRSRVARRLGCGHCGMRMPPSQAERRSARHTDAGPPVAAERSLASPRNAPGTPDVQDWIDTGKVKPKKAKRGYGGIGTG